MPDFRLTADVIVYRRMQGEGDRRWCIPNRRRPGISGPGSRAPFRGLLPVSVTAAQVRGDCGWSLLGEFGQRVRQRIPPQAEVNLAVFYEKGWGGKVGMEQAMRWYRAAADRPLRSGPLPSRPVPSSRCSRRVP